MTNLMIRWYNVQQLDSTKYTCPKIYFHYNIYSCCRCSIL